MSERVIGGELHRADTPDQEQEFTQVLPFKRSLEFHWNPYFIEKQHDKREESPKNAPTHKR